MINPSLDGNGRPLSMNNEHFVLDCVASTKARAHEQDIIIDHGHVFLSNLRLVVVGSHTSLDLPLATLFNEKFTQPIFSANALHAENTPMFDMESAKSISWKIEFVNGGVDVFLPVFYRLLKAMREFLASSHAVAANELPNPLELPQAFVDPSNPACLFVPTSFTSQN